MLGTSSKLSYWIQAGDRSNLSQPLEIGRLGQVRKGEFGVIRISRVVEGVP